MIIELWCVHPPTCKAEVFISARRQRSGARALYDLWAQRRWAPAVIPRAENM